MKKIQFASDNYAGICPEALRAIRGANYGHESPYGEDTWTQRACDKFREIFQNECEVFFVFTGTAANSLALACLCQSYHSVICHRAAHIETDECGAPEFFSHGSKIMLAEGENGKIREDEISKIVLKRTDIHYPKPKVLSISQATELGTVYDLRHLKKIGQTAKKFKLKFHMDGARLANAIVHLGCKPNVSTVDCGVDVLCLGGPKNGLSLGEAIIFFNTEQAEEFAYRCKQAGQLASKMRFIAAQWFAILNNNIWLKYAQHANDCAQKLESELRKIDEIKILYPREANSVFIDIPLSLSDFLKKKGWKFYNFIGTGGIRLMCSWDTTEKSINELINDIKYFLNP